MPKAFRDRVHKYHAEAKKVAAGAGSNKMTDSQKSAAVSGINSLESHVKKAVKLAHDLGARAYKMKERLLD
jgi:hypothetical protein